LFGNFSTVEFRGDSNAYLGDPTRKKNYDLDTEARIIGNRTGPKGNRVTSVISDDWPVLTTNAMPVSGP